MSEEQRADAHQLSYLDFELEIGEGKGLEYPVAVLRSPAGEARETMRFPLDELALQNRLLALENALLRSGSKRRQLLTPEQKTVRDFGQELFDALFVGEIRNRYEVSKERARAQGKGLRLKLRMQQAPEMAVLPWEFIHDQRQGDYICLSRNTPVLRYLELPQPPSPLTVSAPLRILGMIAAPNDLERLDIQSERQRVEQALADLQTRGLVELKWASGQTWRDLQREMRGGPWHVFHFIGHGDFDEQTDEGLICLVQENGRAAPLTATQLGRLLHDHYPLRLVVLNSCKGARGSQRDIFSSTSAILLRQGIPAVLAMQYEIFDYAAIELARAFYEALADGLPVDAAVADARIAVSIAVKNTIEWGTPVLHMRSPDGVLFNLQRLPGGAPASPRPKDINWDVEPARGEGDKRKPGAEPPEQRKERREEKPAERPAPAANLQALAAQLQKTTGIEWREVPAGPFWMGNDDQGSDEKPKHQVELPAFLIARFPITNAQYSAFVQDKGYEQQKFWTPAGWAWRQKEKVNGPYKRGGDFDLPDHPVIGVSWYEAVAFTRWLSQRSEQPIRLPSEAEWEKAARGDDGRTYPWGDKWEKGRANTSELGIDETSAVGRFSPAGDSPYGVSDMAGNVWEWCQSLYKPYPYKADDREKPDISGYRVVRGGSWFNGQDLARCAYRRYLDPVVRNNIIGFRIVCAPALPF
jgi:formylglycine-generating enzyme required for sulfatase activity